MLGFKASQGSLNNSRGKEMIGNIFLCVNVHHHLFSLPQYHAKGRSSSDLGMIGYSSMKSSGKISNRGELKNKSFAR